MIFIPQDKRFPAGNNCNSKKRFHAADGNLFLLGGADDTCAEFGQVFFAAGDEQDGNVKFLQILEQPSK